MAPLASWLAARGKARSSAREPTFPSTRPQLQLVRSNLAVGQLPLTFSNSHGRAAPACSMLQRLCPTHHATSSVHQEELLMIHGVRQRAVVVTKVKGGQWTDGFRAARTPGIFVHAVPFLSGLLRVLHSCFPVSPPSLMSVCPAQRRLVVAVPWPRRCGRRAEAPCCRGLGGRSCQLMMALRASAASHPVDVPLGHPLSPWGLGHPPPVHPSAINSSPDGHGVAVVLGSRPLPVVGFASQSRYLCPDSELLALPQS